MAQKAQTKGRPAPIQRTTPTDYLQGYQWGSTFEAGYLSQVIDIGESCDVFRGWLLSASAHLPADEAAFAEALISETREPWHVLLMVDFIASAYRRHLERAKQAA